MDGQRIAAALLVTAGLVVPGPAAAGPPDVLKAGPEPREPAARPLTVEGGPVPGHAAARRAAPAAVPVGTVREWLALDDAHGDLYRKDFRLRAVGAHIEVWVAEDLAFPDGDCRGPVTVTDAQAAALATEFDTVIHPRETAAFGTPPDRDGSAAVLPGDFGGPGDRTVTLVDNVRDDNYYTFPDAPTYVAGFFSAQLADLVDRNVMTIDAWDWAHRTGAAPPSEPTGDECTSRPARPRLYESTFAHEWQHLLQHHADPDEHTWVDEGLADYAQTLTGYVDPDLSVHRTGFDTHLTCFRGYGPVRTAANPSPRDCGGPQNSLTRWDEGAPAEVLADYGIAYQFMLYLRARFGAGVLSRLHRDGAHQGLAGVAAALPPGTGLTRVLHDFQDDALIRRPALNLDNPAAYDRPGAAPNGADYVRLRDANGRPLRGRDLRSVVFTGAATLPPLPLRWTVTDGVLSSGNRSGADDTAIREVTVPAGDPVLRFDAQYGAEDGYDFGYVTVSADHGRTWTAVAGDHTVAGPLGPGLTGTTYGFQPHAHDLSAYAGRTVLIGFRYVSDSTGDRGGWQIRDITVGGREVSGPFRSPTQVRPVPVHAWAPRLAGLAPGRVRVVPPGRFAELRGFDRVVAVIGYDEPSERYDQYAPYRLVVNGVRQPG